MNEWKTYHVSIVIPKENRQRQRHVDENSQQIGQTEAQYGPIDAGRLQAVGPQYGKDYQTVADCTHYQYEGVQRACDAQGRLINMHDNVAVHAVVGVVQSKVSRRIDHDWMLLKCHQTG